MAQTLAGAVTGETSTAQLHALGTRHIDQAGKEWVYVQADATGITGAGFIAFVDEDYAADMIETTVSATAFGNLVAVASIDFAADEFGWLQIYGAAVLRVSASCGANVAINTTATAGQLDDDATSGAEIITGIALTTANGGSAATAAAFLVYPIVGATI